MAEERNVLNITTCPHCGGEKFLAMEVCKQQVEVGKLPKESTAYLFSHKSIIAGPAGTWLTAQMVISFFDICEECGTTVCVHAEVKTVMAGGKELPRAGQGFSTT